MPLLTVQMRNCSCEPLLYVDAEDVARVTPALRALLWGSGSPRTICSNGIHAFAFRRSDGNSTAETCQMLSYKRRWRDSLRIWNGGQSRVEIGGGVGRIAVDTSSEFWTAKVPGLPVSSYARSCSTPSCDAASLLDELVLELLILTIW